MIVVLKLLFLQISQIVSYNPNIIIGNDFAPFIITRKLESHSTNLVVGLYDVMSEVGSTETILETTSSFSQQTCITHNHIVLSKDICPVRILPLQDRNNDGCSDVQVHV